MPPDQLLQEWLALPAIGQCGRKILADLGVTREAIHRAGGLAQVRIQTTGRTWQREFGGRPAIAMPVWGGPPPSIYQGVENPCLIDVIAWRPQEPWQWWYRVVTYGAVLGTDNLNLAYATGQPISLHTTPLDWLQANCCGAVFLEDCEEVLAA